ncbi:DUF3718 domain-containing protein [Neptunicella marina]|uniref:DUF3718 domain-containing protein n=1 Tax=Neptunicella marina TaxID=2125989 RepID=A0A8J6LZX1_9ALTE|nr:DUF3718 domain-containing protein [Neptunicella marina]MBC3764407.1 DUF3718 domain-containing protein [Neptunicella marina]
MFNRKFALFTLCVAMSATSVAGTHYVAGDNSRATQLCISAALDAPVAFVSKQRESGYSLHYIARNVTCNDVSITKFAQQAGNNRNANRIAMFAPVNARTDILDLSLQQNEKSKSKPQLNAVDKTNTQIVVVGR